MLTQAGNGTIGPAPNGYAPDSLGLARPVHDETRQVILFREQAGAPGHLSRSRTRYLPTN